MLDRRAALLIGILAFLCLLLAIQTAPDGSYQSIIHALSLGFVVSAIFYFLVVFSPEHRRRNLIHANLKSEYDEFRLACISTFLILSDSQEYGDPRMLLDQSEFRRYFKGKNAAGEDRWDALANALQSSEYYLKEIVYYLHVLNEEIRFARNAINIHDAEVFEFLTRLSQEIARMEGTERDYESVKTFCRFLWSVFTGWSWVSGYRESDIIKEMLGRAK
jgi:hypothetical protein